MIKELPHSIQLERKALGGLLKYPVVVFPEVDSWMTDTTFYNTTHEIIYSVMRKIFNSGQIIDKIFVGQKIKEIGVKLDEGIDIFDYLEGLSFTQINESATIKACQELVSLRIRRELIESAEAEKEFVHNAKDQSIDQIINGVDAIHNNKIVRFNLVDKPVNIFENVEKEMEERGNNPIEEIGYATPYPEFNRLYGGVMPGIYAIASRPGQGKTTWIDNLVFEICKSSNWNINSLKLDTEMESGEIRDRVVASISGVPLWYVQTGNWRRNPEMCVAMRRVLPHMNTYKYDHIYVPDKDVDEVCSIIRRWYLNKVGRGNKAIVAYDYIKLTGEEVGNNWAEYQAVGEKINKLKVVCKEISAPCITAIQMNKMGSNFGKKGKDVVDDSTAVGLSDRLEQVAHFLAIFRRKTLDEIAIDGEDRGTHKLIPLKTRYQGKDAAGHNDMVKRTASDGSVEWMNNFLNYDVKNFSISEKGSLHDIVEVEKMKIKLEDKEQGDEKDSHGEPI